MKKTTLHIRTCNVYIVFLLVWIIVGCKKDFLDAKPEKSILVPTSLDDFQALLDNAQNIMNRTPYFGEVAADDFCMAENTIQSYDQNIQNSYRWEKQLYTVPNISDWDLPNRQVFYSNVVLDGLQEYATDSDQERVDNLKGIAFFHRAWALYQLAQQFTLPYNEVTADAVLGLPIRTTADVTEPSKRRSLKDTYEQIWSDVGLAIKLLKPEQSVPTRPSKAAAHALMTRLQLVMQNYAKAKSHADSSLALYNTLLDFNTLDSNKAYPMPQLLLTSNRHPEIMFLSILVPNTYLGSSNNTLVDTSIYNSYDNKDLRKALFFTTQRLFRGSYIGLRAMQFSGLAVDEVYLTRAETNARLGNMEAACADLNTLLINRWETGEYQPVRITDADELLELILAERRKELITRGIRWADLKRLNQEARFAKSLYRKIGNETVELKPDSKRYAFSIPDGEIAASGMEQNER